MSVTAYFVGPDDSGTCEGCTDAMDGNPYTLEDVPEPGTFECMARCRHMVQLGADAPDDVPTVDWSASMGFQATGKAADLFGDVDPASDAYTTAGEQQRADDAAAGADGADDAESESIAQEKAAERLRDFIKDQLSDKAQKSGALGLLGDELTPEVIAEYLVDSGLTIDDLAGELPDDELADITTAMGDLSTATSAESVTELIRAGNVQELSLALADADVRTEALQLGKDGFEDVNAADAYTLADALNEDNEASYVVKLRDSRWYVEEANDA